MAPQNNRKRTLLIIGLVGILIVLTVIGLSTYVINRVNTTVTTLFNQTDVPEFVAAHYYEAVRNHDYATAFGDLDSQATLIGQRLDESAFIKDAIDADTQRGALFSYGLLRHAGDSAQAATQFDASLQRGGQSYTVHIQLRQVGDRWKIVSMDSL
ncbi:MAG TPA: hypothetical protein VMP08_19955 [Anaerolineae bacterium]|nr:hypothetical protein [Anaerolineae bacterium]